MGVTNNSVDKALELLRLLARAQQPLRFTDLQLQSGIPRSTLHSLLGSLEAADFVRRSGPGYEISIAAFEIGTAVRAPASLRSAASPLLDELFAEHGESCHFGMFYEGDVVYLDRRDSTHALRYASRVGERKPAYATALGKAMLALDSDDEAEVFYPGGFRRLTPQTITSRSIFLDELTTARRQGYATESEESTPGVCCIGVASRMARVTYGLSITVPVQRARVADLPKFLPSLRRTMARLDGVLAASEWFGSVDVVPFSDVSNWNTARIN
jgi:DNA-binding IclR family transcriptional regulator